MTQILIIFIAIAIIMDKAIPSMFQNPLKSKLGKSQCIAM